MIEGIVTALSSAPPLIAFFLTGGILLLLGTWRSKKIKLQVDGRKLLNTVGLVLIFSAVALFIFGEVIKTVGGKM